ncbi:MULTISPECIES: response regulator transcription factor [unclassified Kitasatospora]|uniref:response regulator n=1 Tax=unclassified Kitasatospora TaxID=2633591 RepID=UPI001ADED6AA|nr:response regulator transcription factor [Kitasatospora sp. RG8]MBP0452609.1 response regulator transcription factor [Kitasatospora sp. RG8]
MASETTGTGEPAPVRVFLLDDHEVVRRGVHDLLDGEPDLEVIGEAATAEQALVRVPALRPDVAVLDVRLGDGDGVAVCRELRSRMPDLACLMLTSFDDEEALLDAVMAGAAGYVLKQISGTDLVAAVRTVASGRSMLDPGAATRLLNRLRNDAGPAQPASHGPELTVREQEVLALIGEGLTNRQIGERLYLAEKTVKNHVSRLLAKLGVERRVQAALIATEVRRAGEAAQPARLRTPGGLRG